MDRDAKNGLEQDTKGRSIQEMISLIAQSFIGNYVINL